MATMRKLGQDVIDALEKAGKEFADSMGNRSRLQSDRLRRIIEEVRERDAVIAAQLRRPDRPSPHRAPDPQHPDVDGLDAPRAPDQHRAGFGDADSTDYRNNFFDENPDASPSSIVHHAIEQSVLRRYVPPLEITPGMMHSAENLRGIPRNVNAPVHLSAIRRMWNQFYDHHERRGTVPTIDQLRDYATLIDLSLGDLFDPPKP